MRTNNVNTIVDGMNHHCGMKIKTCTNEARV